MLVPVATELPAVGVEHHLVLVAEQDGELRPVDGFEPGGIDAEDQRAKCVELAQKKPAVEIRSHWHADMSQLTAVANAIEVVAACGWVKSSSSQSVRNEPLPQVGKLAREAVQSERAMDERGTKRHDRRSETGKRAMHVVVQIRRRRLRGRR